MSRGGRPLGLGRLAARGAAISFLAQVIRLVIQLLSLVVLSRFLSPEDVGLVATAMVVIGLALVLQDLGLSSAAIQATNLSDGQRSNLMWINVALGSVLTLVTLLAAVPLAGVFGQPALIPIFQVLAAQFVLASGTAQFRANIVRELRFTSLAIAEVSAQIIAVTCAIWLSVLGFGPWALVLQVMLSQVVLTSALVPLGRWPIRWYNHRHSIRALLFFGANLAGTQVLNYLSRSADVFIIGATLSSSSVGLYNRALQTITVPLQQLQAPATTVALPVLSKLREQPGRFSEFLITGQTALLWGVMSLLAFVSAFSESIVAIVLGPQWTECAPLIRILAIGGLFQAAGYATYWIFLAKGLTSSNLRFDLYFRPLSIGCIFVGSLGGLSGIALGFMVSSFIGWVGALLWLSRIVRAPLLEMFLIALRAMIVFLGTSYAAKWLLGQFGIEANVLMVTFGLLIYTSTIIALIGVIATLRADFRRALKVLHYLRGAL
ncbi:lipopolysaccharide biosynthesis protein [Cryobacterium serini]|uniref:lipopolysaccharide biosynthesis protein n=1 Tax=Cryobacterium serini TaxID=1259201 RepID=UPI001F54580A|nr:lipopolysaccharide biosynthesis protein [Cryobacterium serini]